MLTRDELTRLARLLNHLHLCTGVKFALMDDQGREVYTSSDRAPFCRAIMSEESGMEKCLACDRAHVAEVLRTGRPRRYICHAGLYEAATPVVDNGRVAAIILFGQMLDDAPRDEQWARVRSLCAWHGDEEALREAFLQLRRISAEQMDACTEIAMACVSEVRLQGLAATGEHGEAQRIRLYIDAHYAEPLTSDALAAALHMGKTKLYDLCAERFRMTPMQLVAKARLDAAQELLLSTGESIRRIAQSVGYPDQNYFTKVFRRETGLTPSAFRAKKAKNTPGSAL